MTNVHREAHSHGAGHALAFHAPHVVDRMIFVRVIIALLVLTIVTVGVSRLDFGSANMLVAMAIAAVKAALVMTFFMHLRWDTAINNIAIISSFLFLSLLFIFTLSDYATRGRTDRVLIDTPGNESLLQQNRNAKMHQ